MKQVKVEYLSWDDFIHATTGDLVTAPDATVIFEFNGERVGLELTAESIHTIRNHEFIAALFKMGHPVGKPRAPLVHGNAPNRRKYRLAQREYCAAQGIRIPKDKSGYIYTGEPDTAYEAYLAGLADRTGLPQSSDSDTTQR